MTTTVIIICCIASFVAGFIDSIAGGGGLITLPTMLLSGVPPHIALGSGKFASTMGTGLALINFARSNLIIWKVASAGIVLALIGAFCGSYLTLLVDSAILKQILIILLPVAMLGTFFPINVKKSQNNLTGVKFWVLLPLVCFLIGAYDGFFGPATGSFFILAFHWILGLGLIQASATSKVFNSVTNISSTVVFLWTGKVLFVLAIPMAIASMLGNWLGSRIAIKAGPTIIKKFLVVSMLLLLTSLIYSYFFQSS